MSVASEKPGVSPRSFSACKRVTSRITSAGVTLAFMISVALAAGSSQLLAQLPRNTAQPVNSQDLMWWLPTDTESVVAARGPFLIPTGSNETSDENDPGWFTRKTTQTEIRSAFEELPLEVFTDLDLTKTLKNATVAYAMQGSRHFRAPQGGSEEVMDFEGCSILVFERDLGLLINVIQQSLVNSGARSEMIGGVRVLVDQDETSLLAFPRPTVLLGATNRQDLLEVLARMAQRKTSRALPVQLPEWRFLDANARFWGLRHYDPTQAKLDPTSPLGEDRSFDPGDPKAIGVLFALDPENEQILVMTSLTGDEAKARADASSGKAVSEPQEGVRFEVKLVNPKPGVLERIFTLDRSTSLDYSILTIAFALGHGMNF